MSSALPTETDSRLLEVTDLKQHFVRSRGRGADGNRPVLAVDGVSFHIDRGETFGIVGESGSGKTTLGRAVVRLYEPTDGKIVFEGNDITHLSDRSLASVRQRLQMVFQNPMTSLNPQIRVSDAIEEPLVINRVGTKDERRSLTRQLLDRVGIPSRFDDSYPYELSGGQRQRVGIARALALEPDLVVTDEPTSALDLSIQAQILNLLQDLQSDLDLSFMFITHDLEVVRHVSTRVGVMYLGRIVEQGPTDTVFSRPLHPYTTALASSSRADGSRERIVLSGEVPSAVSPPSGCHFRTRCPIARSECAESYPPLTRHDDQLVACFFPGELQLTETHRAGGSDGPTIGSPITVATGTRPTPATPPKSPPAEGGGQ